MAELRDLPAVDTILNAEEFVASVQKHGVQAVRNEIRSLQDAMRKARSVPSWGTSPGGYVASVETALYAQSYTPVFNLTGTVVHTNLGRALLSEQLWQDIQPLVTRPMNLEYNLQTGKRGDRDAIVEERLCRLTGCEAATVVNNNAAALMLCLNTFAAGKKVPVSRGELIEIGGSFRLPELMSRSGCKLLEVGTTNRTHPKDYTAVMDEAAMLLKVHPSNYYIAGFTQEVDASTLAELAQQAEIPSCVDLGSGTLVDLTQWGLPAEPTPQSVLNQGVDLVTFSGDKLLGGVQAGIIVGKKDLVDAIKKNPMKRALRADKITLAVLEHTLKLYEQPETLTEHIPLLKTLTLTEAELQQRAEQLKSAFSPPWQVEVAHTSAQIGSGALPDKTIASVALVVRHAEKSAEQIRDTLRGLSTPVIGRVADDKCWLDLHGADPMHELIEVIGQLSS